MGKALKRYLVKTPFTPFTLKDISHGLHFVEITHLLYLER